MANKKEKGKGKKYGRNARDCLSYRLSNKRLISHARRVWHHLTQPGLKGRNDTRAWGWFQNLPSTTRSKFPAIKAPAIL